MPCPAIGIDLGTTRSVVATLERGKPRAIPNALGQLVTPSVVAAIAQGKILVGQIARRQAAANPEGTVASVKRALGSPRRFRLGPQEYSPQEVAAFILRQLKEDAEAGLGEKVEEVVLGVPAYFNDRQRQATREAALLAGLQVRRLINEPTAAALAYGLHREEVHTVMVWDLGGGTFDVSILEVGEGIFEVRAVSGDNSLGGDDFDRRVMDYLAQEYRRTWDADFPPDGGAWERLREAAEKAKRQLSASSQARVFIPRVESRPRPRHLEAILTQELLGELVADLLHRLIPPARQALADAGLAPQGVDRVILVGNGTKMPAMRRLVAQLMGQEPYRYLDPDLVTALGAAIEAARLLGQGVKAILLDVLPLSLGVETQGGLFAPIIPRNTPLPASASQVFTTAADYQTAMEIHILQGERPLAADNVYLGYLQPEGLPPAPRGTVKVEVAFEADVDGLVHVSAQDLASESEVTTAVADSKQLDPQEIRQRLQEAHKQAAGDRKKRGRIQAGIEADNALAAAEMAQEAWAGPPDDPEVARLVAAVEQVQQALARGIVPNIKRRCTELRSILATLGGKGSPPRLPQL